MKISAVFWVCVLCVFIIFQMDIACRAPSGQASQSITLDSTFTFQYQLAAPSTTFELPARLNEISGLTLLPDGDRLAAIQDEDGIVFIIDKKSGEVLREIPFWNAGDYEGLEMVGNTMYVLKSSGDIFEVQAFATEAQKTVKHENFLNKKANTEGLAYNSDKHQLLIACKGQSHGDTEGITRSVYSFDLQTKRMDSIPVFSIDVAQVQQYLDTDAAIAFLDKVIETFTPAEGGFTFAPSGIARHPHTGDYYLLSSVGKRLLVVRPGGAIRHIEKLKKKIHRQPEGICFEPDGTLWISNEGKNGIAKLYRFDLN